MNFQTICRICTSENLGMLSIFEPYDFPAHNSEIFKVIIDCASVQIQKFDGFSEQICRSCLDQLSQAYSFKKLCEDSDYKFRNNLIASNETEIKNEFCEEETAIIYDGNIKKDVDGNNKISKVEEVQCDVEMETEKSFQEDQVAINQQDVDAISISSDEFDICPKIANSDTSYKFVPAEEYLADMKAHAEQPPQMCEEVDYEFKDDSSDEFHDKSDFSDDDTEINYNETKFKPCNDEIVTRNKCDRGGEVIQNQVSCKSTDCNEQNGLLYKCEVCSKSFTTNISLAYHMRIHKQACQCEICGESFPGKQHLISHKIKVHKVKDYHCYICKKQYMNGKNLAAHLRGHTKTHKCDICEKTFAVKKSLMRHASLHTGEKPFKCDICEKTFTERKSLMSHASLHTGEKPFKCVVCGKTFTLRQNLMRHASLHTGEKPFKCDICGNAFRENYLLRRHIKLLHLEGRQK